MRFVTAVMATLVGAAFMTGCGGGGGGSGAGGTAAAGAGTGVQSAPANGSWLKQTPAAVTVKSYEGESVRFQVNAVSSRTFDKPFNVAVIDSKGVIVPGVTLTKVSDLEYAVELRTNAAVAGTYSTDLQLRLCEDDPQVCRTPLPGSPWQIPVTLTVATPAQAQERLKFTPAAFDLVTYQGESAAFSLVASGTSFPGLVNVGVFDSSGVLAAPVTMREAPSGHFSADPATAAGLTVGEHAGALEVRVCLDDPRQCRSPVSGSPWRVPLKVAVRPSTNLSALATIPSLSAWSTYNGNAAQNAHLRASFDPAAFNRRWNQPAAAGVATSAPVIDNGRVFVIRSGAGKWELSATSEASGEQLWRYEIGAETGTNALAVGNGRVYARVLAPEGGYLWTFDAATGQLASKSRLVQMPYELHRAPAVVGDTVYLGHAGGMEKFNAATGLIEWKNQALPFVGAGWTPVVDQGRAYTFLPGEVAALDTADGNVAFRVSDPALGASSGDTKSLVVDANLAVARIGSRLVGIDLQSRTRTWLADSSTVGQHVLANGTVYAFGEAGMVLEARAAATGVLQWKTGRLFTSSSSSDSKRLIVTANLAFVSSPTSTQAIDLVTHQVVWSTPVGGELALSDRGVLYIVTAAGGVFAINLR